MDRVDAMRPSGWKTAVAIQIFASAAAAAFWGVWFLGDRSAIAIQSNESYVNF